jgi:L-aspartate oxidase
MPDLIVVGAGAAGLYTALCASREGARVALVSALPLAETASYWAQGGLAAALALEDSPGQHLEDTLAAGRGLVRRSAAEVLCREAPERFADLVALGVRFDADADGHVELGLEGGHSVRRIVHAGGSATGRRLLRTLAARVVADAGIEVREGVRVAALAQTEDRVDGVHLDDGTALAARAVVLASGGGAALWSRTTNPPGSWGSGLLLSRAAGADLADLEFVQFHPTAVTGIRGREGFLITEAIRGEGATLHGPDGERFVDELAPRDAVARAIFRLMRETGADHVDLDMRHVDPFRFPNVFSALREAGHDATRDPVPVAPASHYVMGGVATDLDGRAAPGLYAVGEVACTGLHGANRLASNSLSECFVFGRRAALSGLGESKQDGPGPPAGVAPEPPSRATREAMWRLAGLERNAADLVELGRDLHPLAQLVAACALAREETRGGHARTEFPQSDGKLDSRHSVILAQAFSPALVSWD